MAGKLGQILQKPYRLLLRDIIKIFGLLPPQGRMGVILVGALMLAQACMELATINGIRQLGMVTARPGGLADEIPWRWLFSFWPGFGEWAAASPERYLLLAAVFVALLVGLKNATIWFTMWKTSKVSENISLDVAVEILRRFLYAGYRWHLSNEGKAALQVMLWRSHLSSLLMQQLSAVTGFFACAVLFAGLIVAEPFISLFSITVMGGGGGLLYAALRKSTDRCATLSANAQKEENATILAVTRGIRDVLLYGQQKSFLDRLIQVLNSALRPKIFLGLVNGIPSLVLEAMGFLLIPMAILIMNYMGFGLDKILSAVMVLVLTAWRVLPYLNRGVGQMVAIRALRPMAMPVLDYLFRLRENPEELVSCNVPTPSFENSLALKEVTFTYPGAKKPALDHVSVNIPKGAQVGFIGPSGAGKSTLCYLLCALCRPDRGELLLDGRTLSPEETAAFRKQVGFVPQAPFLMPGTLAANVTFSQWGMPWNDARVFDACRKAALDFIPLTADGIRYPIDENGNTLSGGQAQRVSIARALYADPRIIIFDEATSALDTGNENVIVSSMKRLRGDVTTIIIAHRLSTVAGCDLIYWLDGGRVVDCGTPAEILPRYSASFITADTEM